MLLFFVSYGLYCHNSNINLKHIVMKNFSKVMLSFIVGALAGAAAGILLAPDKGKNTRKKIKDSIDDLSEKAKDSINDLGAKAKKTFTRDKVAKEAEPA